MRDEASARPDQSSPHDTEQIIAEVRVRFGLRKRAADVLRVMIRDGEQDDDGWHYRGSIADIAEAAGLSYATTKRGLRELHKPHGILFSGARSKGVIKRYRVRLEVITGEATFADDPPRQKTLTQVGLTADPGQRDPGQTDLGQRGGERGAPSTQSAGGGLARALNEGVSERETLSLTLSEGGAGGTEVTSQPDPGQPLATIGSLPRLPTSVHDPTLTDAVVAADVADWRQANQLPASSVDPVQLLAAVLAARHARAIDPDAYVNKCLRDEIREHWLRRAENIIRHPEAHDDRDPHRQSQRGRVRDQRHAEQRSRIPVEDL